MALRALRVVAHLRQPGLPHVRADEGPVLDRAAHGVTIIDPIYVDQGHTIREYGKGQWVLLDTTPAARWVTQAACTLLLREVSGRSTSLDMRVAWDNWALFLRGKQAEAAYAMHMGLHIESIVDDQRGSPDFVHDGHYLDVKCAGLGKRHVSVQLPRLNRMTATGLHHWRIVGAKSQNHEGLVTLLGWRPATYLLADYEIRPPERANSYPYIAIPFEDFLPFEDRA